MLTFGLFNNFYVGPELYVWILGGAVLLAFIIGSIITYTQSASYNLVWPLFIVGMLLIILSLIVGWNPVDIILYRIQNGVPEQGIPEGFIPIGKR